jgi:PAS domain S-box-containing protein
LRELLGNALFRNQPFHDFEVEHDFPHIGRKTMRLNAQRIPREDGDRNRAVLLSIEDISVRRAEAEIRYQRLFEAATDGILVLDAETMLVTDVNPALLKMTGFSREDLAGKKLSDLPPFRDASPAALTAGNSQAQAVPADGISITSRTGQAIDVEIVANRHTIGSLVAIQLNLRDVTARRRDERARAEAEESLKIVNERLKRANSDLEQFAFAVSHDIQEPLRTISLYTELLQKLIASLLSFTQSTAPFEPPTALVDTAAVVQLALANLRNVADENQAIVSVGDLPPVRMHEWHLAQIFQNLIGNALKYRGAAAPRVTISGNESEHEWVFSVMDNGIGIDPTQVKSIFGLFERLGGPNRPGSGIGLAICAKIVGNYKGRIWVESAPGEGSNFFFTVPKKP